MNPKDVGNQFAAVRQDNEDGDGDAESGALNKELIVFRTRMRGLPNHLRIETEEMYLRWRVLNRMGVVNAKKQRKPLKGSQPLEATKGNAIIVAQPSFAIRPSPTWTRRHYMAGRHILCFG